GAFADTMLPGVDAVVSNTVADALGVPGPSAMVLSSGSATSLAARVRPVIGTGGEVVVLGSSAEERVAFMTGSEAAKRFGVLRYQLLPDRSVVPDPAWVRANIVRARVPILGMVTCHRLLIPQLFGALAEVER